MAGPLNPGTRRLSFLLDAMAVAVLDGEVLMSRAASSSARFKRPAAVAALAAIIAIAAIAVAVRRPKAPERASGDEGTATLTVALAEGSTATSVGYVVKSPNGRPVAEGTMEVTGPNVPLSADVALPPGNGYTITFLSNTSASGRNATWFLGKRTIDVDVGRSTPVDLGTVSIGAAPPSGSVGSAATAAGGSSTTGGTAGDAGGSQSAASCQSCELATEQGRCDPGFLSAVSGDPPSWGCGTLATPRERAACSDLLHCLNQNACARGTNPFLGCFCGAAEMQSCLSGSDISGPCIGQYEAAAAIAGGPAVGSPPAELVRFLATVGANPRTPVGLADNIEECALQAHCDACNSL